MVLTAITGHPPFSSNHRETGGRKAVLLTGPGSYRACLGPRSEVTGTERAHGPVGSAFTGVEVEGGGLGFHRLTTGECKS